MLGLRDVLPSAAKLRPPRTWLAWIVLLCGLGLTALGWRANQSITQELSSARFQARSDELHAAIHSRMLAYVNVLRGAQSTIGVIGHPTRDDWSRLHQTLRIAESYPGIVGIVYIRAVTDSDFDGVLSEIRSFEPGFSIRPPGVRPFYAIVTSVEPRTASNLPVIGSDSWAHPERRNTLEFARDSGEAKITGKVSLVIDDPKMPQPGFLMYQPVYRSGALPGSVEERRAALLGFVTIGFRLEPLMKGTLGEVSGDVAIRVFDGEVLTDENLFHASHPSFDFSLASHHRTRTFSVAGRIWTIQYAQLQGDDEARDRRVAWGIAIGGLAVSALLFAIVLSLLATRSRAEALASRMTNSLRESEGTFRRLFEQSSDAILLIDHRGVFVECNQAALDLLKMTREQFLLLPPAKISPEFQPDGRRSDELALEMIAAAYEKGLHRFDWTCINAEGGEFVVEVSLMPVAIKGQTMLHTTWRDVTERIRNERNFRNAMMFMPIPIGIANSAGSIVFFNEAFTSTYGYSVGDFADIQDWATRVYPDPAYREEMLAIWNADVEEAVRLGQVTPRREYKMRSKSGQTKLAVISMRPIGDQFVTAFEDVTQSKLNEEELAKHRLRLEHLVAERTTELAGKNRELEDALLQLRQAQDHLIQESKLSSLGEVVAGVAHELNTPIGNARTVATTLCDQSEDFAHRLEDAQGIRKSEFKAFLRQVTEGSRLLEHNLIRASDLIHSFKQVAVDRTSSQRRRFDLRTVAEEVILTLHPTLKKTPFVVGNDIEPGIVIEGYPGPLGQVIVNLIENSLVHGLEGRPRGEIRVRGHQVGQEVQLEVADNGCGIPKENIARIFDPFFTTRLGQGGSGLGLNIVFNIVNGLLGGKITVESTQGVGSTFKIVIPLISPVPQVNDAGLPRHG